MQSHTFRSLLLVFLLLGDRANDWFDPDPFDNVHVRTSESGH